jgi:hypothetical protein
MFIFSFHIVLIPWPPTIVKIEIYQDLSSYCVIMFIHSSKLEWIDLSRFQKTYNPTLDLPILMRKTWIQLIT